MKNGNIACYLEPYLITRFITWGIKKVRKIVKSWQNLNFARSALLQIPHLDTVQYDDDLII